MKKKDYEKTVSVYNILTSRIPGFQSSRIPGQITIQCISQMNHKLWMQHFFILHLNFFLSAAALTGEQRGLYYYDKKNA